MKKVMRLSRYADPVVQNDNTESSNLYFDLYNANINYSIPCQVYSKAL